MKSIIRIIGLSLAGTATRGYGHTLGGLASASEVAAITAAKTAISLRKEQARVKDISQAYALAEIKARTARASRKLEVETAAAMYQAAARAAIAREFPAPHNEMWSSQPERMVPEAKTA